MNQIDERGIRDELRDLVLQTIDGSATDADCARLESLLQMSPNAARWYLEDFDLAGTLLWDSRRAADHVWIDQLKSERVPVVTLPEPSPATLHRRRWWPTLTSVAAVAVLLYGGFVFLAWNLRPNKPPSIAGGDGASVATVRDLTDVRWSSGSRLTAARGTPLTGRRGNSIHPGEPLRIESGTIELELNAGTKLVVEGPADCSVDGDNRVSLRSGKLLARVPEQAIGFTVDTPTARIVDLGTEFGVRVSSEGTSEIAVKTGKIDVVPLGDQSVKSQKTLRLGAGEGVKVAKGDGTVTPLAEADFRLFESIDAHSGDRKSARDEYEVLAWYRCGEDDVRLDSKEVSETVANRAATVQSPLKLFGSVWNVNEGVPRDSQSSLLFDPRRNSQFGRANKVSPKRSDWVIEVWAYAERRPDHCTLVHLGDASKNGFGIYGIEGRWGGHTPKQHFIGAAPCEVGKWTHLALVHQSDRCVFLVNGFQAGTTWVPTETIADDFLVVGGFQDLESDKVSEVFPGKLDEIRVIELKRPFKPQMLNCVAPRGQSGNHTAEARFELPSN
jgi:hypothetical protein